MTGLYIHVPFCRSKCRYCDFYSVSPENRSPQDYRGALAAAMRPYAGETADTVYFGGGNPLLPGAEWLCAVLNDVRELFSVRPDAEITLEANPEDVRPDALKLLLTHGFNRISVGVQSLDDPTLRLLGRRHDAETALSALKIAVQAGFPHVSADLMLALPGQTAGQVRDEIDRLTALGIDHLSAYLLKLEPGTPMYADPPVLPDEDAAAGLYLAACDACRRSGLEQYEISNFARPGGRSRHNLRYWKLEPYLGFGPAAHSFFGGKRFYYPRSLPEFLERPTAVCPDGDGGGRDEQIALSLRLTDGLDTAQTAALPPALFPKFRRWADAGLCRFDNGGLRLTPEGFLVSNSLIAEILAAADA